MKMLSIVKRVSIVLSTALLTMALALPPQLKSASYRYNQIEMTFLYPTLIKRDDGTLDFIRRLSIADNGEGTSQYIEPLRGKPLLCGFRVCNDFINKIRIDWLANQREIDQERLRMNALQEEITTSKNQRELLAANYQHSNCETLQAGPSEPGFSCQEREIGRPLGACVIRTVGNKLCELGLGRLTGKFIPAFGAEFVGSLSCEFAVSKFFGEQYNVQDQLVSSSIGTGITYLARIGATILFGRIGLTAALAAEATVDVVQCYPKMADRCVNNYRNWLAEKELYFEMHSSEINACQSTMSNITKLDARIAELNGQYQAEEEKVKSLVARGGELEASVIQVDA